MSLRTAVSYESVLGRSRRVGEEKSYQQRAVDELLQITCDLLPLAEVSKGSSRDLLRNHILFQAPTGSGKTIVAGGFMDSLNINRNNVVYLWVTQGPTLVQQSLEKFERVFNLECVEQSTLIKSEDLKPGMVIGVNWEKLKTGNIRFDTERTDSIQTIAERSREQGLQIVMFIDEAHTGANTPLSDELVEGIDPDVIIDVTATPEETVAYDQEVVIDIQDVKDAGFIKQGIIINHINDYFYDEELREKENISDLTEYFLFLSLKQREHIKELVSKYASEYDKKSFNPLLVVQLPDANKKVHSDLMEQTEEFLATRGITRDNGKLAIYTHKEHTGELDEISNDPKVEVLMFKQAISKGWDCPRASLITMLRNPKKEGFVTQTIGRILRMPYLEKYPELYDELNYGYVYLEESDNKILMKIKQDIITKHDEGLAIPKKKGYKSAFDGLPKGIWKVKTHQYIRRKQFKTEWDKIDWKKEFEFGGSFSHTLASGVVDTTDIFDKTELSVEQVVLNSNSEKDLYRVLQKNADKHDIPIDLLLDTFTEIVEEHYGEDFSLKKLYEDILVNYPMIIAHNQRIKSIIDSAEKYETEWEEWKIPEMISTKKGDKEVEFKSWSKKTPYRELYISSNQLEKEMITHLVRNDEVLKWHKNGDSGRKHFSIPYTHGGKNRLFYPDFLIETEDNIYIVETKGMVDTDETHKKYEALKNYEEQIDISYMPEIDKEPLEKPLKVALVATFEGELYAYTGNHLDREFGDITKWEKLEG